MTTTNTLIYIATPVSSGDLSTLRLSRQFEHLLQFAFFTIRSFGGRNRNFLEVKTPFLDLEFELANNSGLDCHQSKLSNFSTIEHWTRQHAPHLFHLVEGVKRNANRVVDLIWIGEDVLKIGQSNLLASCVLQNNTKGVCVGV